MGRGMQWTLNARQEHGESPTLVPMEVPTEVPAEERVVVGADG